MPSPVETSPDTAGGLLRRQSPKPLASAARAVPASMAVSALRDITIVSAAAPTAIQMRGPAVQVLAATIEISTDTDMDLRKASSRGVIDRYDMIQTPPTRVAIVTEASRMMAPMAATLSTMAPHPDEAARQR